MTVLAHLLFLFLTFFFFGTQVKAASNTNFAILGGDAGRSGFVNSRGPNSPNALWIYDRNEWNGGSRAVYSIIKNGVVYTLTESQHILALDLNNKNQKWLFDAKKEIGPNVSLRSLAAGEKYLFVVSSIGDGPKPPGQIFALNLTNGEIIWQYSEAYSSSHSLPLVVNNSVLVGDDGGFLYNINQENGQEIWRKDLQAEEIHSSPTLGAGLIFIGTEQNRNPSTKDTIRSHLFALKLSTGEIVWEFPIKRTEPPSRELPDLVHGTAAYKNGKVYFGVENGSFYSLESQTGKLVWEQKGFGWFTSAPALDNENVYIGNWNGQIYSFNQNTGAIVWSYGVEKDAPFEVSPSGPGGRSQKQGINSWPLVTADKVFLGTSNGYFYALNKKTGELIWKEKYGPAWAVISGETLIIPNHSPQDSLKGEMILALSERRETGTILAVLAIITGSLALGIIIFTKLALKIPGRG